MSVCTFFGHRDCPDAIKPKLLEAIRELVADGVTFFYVGNHGRFDQLALSCLRELKKERPDLVYSVALSYMPSKSDTFFFGETVMPEGIETVPKRFAIDLCNRWMLAKADVAIVYVVRSYGGAAKYAEKAENAGKKVIRIH